MHRRDLLARAAKVREHRLDSVRGHFFDTGGTGDTALDIVAVGLDAKGHFGQVGLGGVVEELQRLGGHSNREGQHPGSGWIEGAGMADPLFTEETARAGDDIEACPAGGLVDHEVAMEGGGAASLRGCQPLRGFRGCRSLRSLRR
ncbi:MAG: hypothetical protein K0S14_2869 [Thermomicrobiales bacterium]|nr:hypothetical protein [Thermomicrobiales bacterium]